MIRVGRLRAGLVCAAIAVAACSRDATPAVPAASFPSLDAGEVVRLDAETLAADALEPGSLQELLERTRFATGSERTFVGDGGVRSVTARVLEFGSVDGAAEYLRWIEDHASDILGETRVEPPIEVGGGVARVFSHAPGGCCPKAMTTVLAAWRRGNLVLSVLASGSEVRGPNLALLAAGFDRAAAETPSEEG